MWLASGLRGFTEGKTGENHVMLWKLLGALANTLIL